MFNWEVQNLTLIKFVATQFNLRAKGTTTITSETARKWMRGIAVPEIDRFKVLFHWLDLHPGELFGSEPKADQPQEINALIDILEKQLLHIKDAIDEYKN